MTEERAAQFSEGSPAAQGYRMLAEWALHAGTWITWPHYEGTWPGKLDAVVPAFVAMVEALRQTETVHINVLNDEREVAVRRLLAENGVVGGVLFHRLPTDNEWCRDYGAIFVVREREGVRERAATNWGFNNWGDKYHEGFEKNNHVPAYMAGFKHVPLFHGEMILEGGSIEVNGEGLLLTTESCLLNPNRNPDLTKPEIEQRLRDYLGAHTIVWLGDGIEGDDTDGHIDDLTRFVAPDTVVTVVEPDPSDANHEPLRENADRMGSLKTSRGDPIRVVELPMPAPIYYENVRLPASYANFYIANGVVLLPVFGDPNDNKATEILQNCFPTRRIVGIPSSDLVWGLGACHCLTQQVPAGKE